MVELIRRPTTTLRPIDAALRSSEPWWRVVDWVLAGCALVLGVIGSLLVWSATRTRQIDLGADPRAYLKRQVLNLALGLVLGVIVAAVEYRALRRWAPVVYAASCIGLLAVLAVGTTVNGAHSWIALPAGFEVQPSEFAKLGLIVSMALLLAERRRRDDLRRGFDVPLALGLAAVPMGLIMLQPDVGTVFVFVFVILAMLSVAGVSWRWIVGLVALGVVVAYLSVALHILKNYQLDRFKAFANPAAQNLDAGYNVHQAKIAIGSGGLTGTGLFQGSQTNGRFVPEQQTDFIFTVAGEEFGLLGAGAIVVLFAIMLWRALRIAGHSPDLFGRLVAVGVAAWFVCQVFVNIGMTLGIMPVTGLPLPFLSYGGSAMFANCVAVGLLQNVQMRNAIAPLRV
ncbi:MAG: rod shape-determining protein RodA [Mycobacteriales bacterium]|nr:MAG: rod shape-determining protein RodA [Pseudonocardiales bacterium]